MKIKIIDHLSDKGLVRDVNEDAYKLDASHGIIVVSDGMGGYTKGDVASDIVCEKFLHELKEFSISNNIEDEEVLYNLMVAYLNNATHQSAHEIITFVKNNNLEGVTGATVAGVYFYEHLNKAILFHLGDSRVYRIRDCKMEQMMEDHVINTHGSGSSNVLTKAIGNFELFEVDISIVDTKEDDLFIVCSDGIYNFIEDKEIYDIISSNTRDICETIKKQVYNNGARDNLTMVLARVE